jgi:hypothetical protein
MTLVSESAPIEESGTIPWTNSCECEAHKFLDGKAHKLKYGRIHNYTYKPRPWRFKTVANDPWNYFLGVELETDNHANFDYSRVWDTMAVDMRRPKNLWFAKRDASVSGPEFVSQPATYAFWEKSKGQVGEMFKMLLHAGYRSYDNDKAGMHVNIDKGAFDDADHLYRMLTLVHFSPVWARRMAQRTNESMKSWADVDLGDKPAKSLRATRRQLSEWAMNAHVDRYRGWELNPNYRAISRPYIQRYTALNVMRDRIEFRLPRGTLRLDRFYKNLQWTVSMIEFTRICGVLDARPAAYMDYVAAFPHLYPDLTAFLRERSPRLRSALSR